MITKTIKIISWIILSLLLISAIAILPYTYFSEFGPLSKYSWHNNQSWANFGSFIGGTLGPILSGFAFLGVWKTYKLQNQQLQYASKQRKSEDIQRLITSTCERIDSTLQTPVELIEIISNSSSEKKHSVEFCIRLLGELVKTIEDAVESAVDGAVEGKAEEGAKEAVEFIQKINKEKELHLLISMFSNEAENLSWLLIHQNNIFNESTLIDYYILRFQSLLNNMISFGAPVYPMTQKVFRLPLKN